MKVSILASLAVSALLAATSVCADAISSFSSSKSLRGSSATFPSPSAQEEGGLVLPQSRDLQLSPENGMECYINGQSPGFVESVDCTASLLASCTSYYNCQLSYQDAQRDGSAHCSTWAQWPVKADGGTRDDHYADDGEKDCFYAVSCCKSSS